VSATPRASVVIVNHNGGDLVLQAVRSVLGQTLPDVELVLVDNASSDGSYERVAALDLARERVCLIRSERNLGCAGGRNRGSRAARGDVIAYLDDDAIASPRWMESTVSMFAAAPQVGIVASTSLFLRNPRLINSLGGFMNLQGYPADQGLGEPLESFPPSREPLYAMGNGLVVRRALFQRLGGFDDTYKNYFEDADFCLRARLAGHAIALNESEPLLHYGGHSDKKYSRKQMLTERHRIRTVLKLYEPRLLLTWLRHELKMFVHGEHMASRTAWLNAVAWNLLYAPSLLAARSRVQGRIGSQRLPGLWPTWGVMRTKDYNLPVEPSPASLETGIRVGDHELPAITYGFYWPEHAWGEHFRWTDDVAGLLVRVSERVRRIDLRVLLPRERFWPAPRCWVYIVDRARGHATESVVVSKGGQVWDDVTIPVDLEPGEYELIFQPERHVEESGGWHRRLGIAVASVSGA